MLPLRGEKGNKMSLFFVGSYLKYFSINRLKEHVKFNLGSFWLSSLAGLGTIMEQLGKKHSSSSIGIIFINIETVVFSPREMK